MQEEKIKQTIRKFIENAFIQYTDLSGFKDSDSFMENGIIDSTGVLELLEFMESTFSIQVEDDEVIPDNLDSLENLALYISSKINATD